MSHFRNGMVVICLFIGILSGSAFCQYDQKIPARNCIIKQKSVCLEPVTGQTYTVSSATASFDTLLSFCLSLDSSEIAKAVNIIFAIDRSGSMCVDEAGYSLTGGDSCKGMAKNDIFNRRITAANDLIDIIKSRNASSMVGVVTFASEGSIATSKNGIPSVSKPLLLTDANVITLKKIINNATCAAQGLGKSRAVQKVNAACNGTTFIGEAVDTSMDIVDLNYSDTINRHIILLTDGLWGDCIEKPDTLIARYHQKYPGRELPTIHSIFLSDSLYHVQNRKPALGLIRCNPWEPMTLDSLRYLLQISSATDGKIFMRETPTTIVNSLKSLIDTIVISNPTLKSVTIQNVTTGFTTTTTPEKLAGPINGRTEYQAKIQQLTLNSGVNKIIITKEISRRTGTVLERDSFYINRSNSSVLNPIDIFNEDCGIDTLSLDVSTNLASALISTPIVTSARVLPDDLIHFRPDRTILRALTAFSVDVNTVALYHLESSLADAKGTSNGASTDTDLYSTTDAAFGASLAAGKSFTATISSPPAGNFLIEAWIKINNSGQPLIICSGTGFTFGVNAERKLYVSGTMGTVVSKFPLDQKVWIHVGVSRSSASMILFANGLPISVSANSSGTLPAAMTFGSTGTGGLVDEIRISNSPRRISTMGVITLTLPLATMTWTVGSTTTTGDTALLASSQWSNGITTFSAVSANAAQVIFNLYHVPTIQADTVLMWSKNSPPVKYINSGYSILDIQLLTPADQRIAGKPILAIVHISTSTGDVAGKDCFTGGDKTAIYQDNLGSPQRLPDTINVDGTAQILNNQSASVASNECFTNGYDTVSFVMHYAPFDAESKPDSLHEIFVQIAGLKASTVPFILLPDTLDSLNIESYNAPLYRSTPDTTLNSPTDNLIMYAIGYDKFNNKIGGTLSNWSVESLPQFFASSVTSPRSNMLYTTTSAEDDESGYIIIRAASNSDIFDRIHVNINGPGARVDSAFTYDLNGDGYLDQILVYFRDSVTLAVDSSQTLTQMVGNTQVLIAYSELESQSGSLSSKVFQFLITKDVTHGLQTWWRPSGRMHVVGESNPISFTCQDRAGPVIAAVTVTIQDLKDNTKDIVNVALSEPITSTGSVTGKFDYNNAPDDIFNVYVWDSTSHSWQPDTLKLAGIAGFSGTSLTANADSLVEFLMTNNKELFSTDSMNLKGGNYQFVDFYGNTANYINRKVKVKVYSPPSSELRVIPNPASPTNIHEKDLIVVNNPYAQQWVLQGDGGTTLVFDITKVGLNDTIRASMKIFDVVGNIVYRADNPNFGSSLDIGRNQASVYWPGYNQKGMKVAPGVYQAVLYLEYKNQPIKNARLITTIGMKR